MSGRGLKRLRAKRLEIEGESIKESGRPRVCVCTSLLKRGNTALKTNAGLRKQNC